MELKQLPAIIKEKEKKKKKKRTFCVYLSFSFGQMSWKHSWLSGAPKAPSVGMFHPSDPRLVRCRLDSGGPTETRRYRRWRWIYCHPIWPLSCPPPDRTSLASSHWALAQASASLGLHLNQRTAGRACLSLADWHCSPPLIATGAVH